MDTGKREETNEKVDWNLSGAIILQCSNLLNDVSQSQKKGNVWSSFYTLKVVRKLISFRFNKTERDDMKAKEKVLTNCYYHVDQIKNLNSSQNYNRFRNQVKVKIFKEYLTKHKPFSLIDEYQETLMDLMNKYGFMFGDKKNSSKVGYS